MTSATHPLFVMVIAVLFRPFVKTRPYGFITFNKKNCIKHVKKEDG